MHKWSDSFLKSMMQSRGRIALSTRQRSLWIWEKVKFEWGQAFQVGVSMITKILPRFLPERERCDPEEGLSRLQPSRAHGFALLCYADQKPKYDSRGRGPFSGCPAPETPSFEEFLAPESQSTLDLCHHPVKSTWAHHGWCWQAPAWWKRAILKGATDNLFSIHHQSFF